jgi:hypothetical protein
MKRRTFLQSIVAGVTTFALPTRTTAGERGEVIHVFELREEAGVYGFQLEVPTDQPCLVIFVPPKDCCVSIRYLSTRVEPARILLSHEDWRAKAIDAAYFAGGPQPVALPVLGPNKPLWLKVRSLTGQNEQLCLVTCYDVVDPSVPKDELPSQACWNRGTHLSGE